MHTSAPSSLRTLAAALLALLYCASLPAEQADDDQPRIAREMIQVLEAYAVYKMGDFDEAYVRYRKLAEAGNRQGMLNLGNMHAAGLAVKQDHVQALNWYQQAADAGDAIGMHEVGRAHELGLGTPRDEAKAATWYLRAAELDNSSAQWALGNSLYQQGQHIAGLHWIRAAARQGDNPTASQFLSNLDGPGNPLSRPSAAEQRAVMAVLAASDQAAQNQDAQALVAALSPQAKAVVRLPDSSAWLTLDKAQLAALWQATFDRAQRYEYQRDNTELLRVDERILAFSSISERLQSNGATQLLEIRENAQLRVINGQAQIDHLRLDIRRLER
ncbi:tetratricopeptide repeat protein [Pseudomonas sp.]|uniref:tetratricopeptide repeat protein n=1 Tax=Pseudomonas sp. TaxID=306 RepID=UPI00272F8F7C|nr:tetratricopeptide repeat protein [Pseudomonas sp.]MDP2245101.1 tetratricopeptide repeat protein [Pseudomonas sp.]